MRKSPFLAATFDGLVSTYAIDHLNREGVNRSLPEASRVLKPRGEFLLMVTTKDDWLNFAFGPLLFHAGTRGQEWWPTRLQEAGFQTLEQGTPPATPFFSQTRPDRQAAIKMRRLLMEGMEPPAGIEPATC